MNTQNAVIDWEVQLGAHREWMSRLAQSRLGDAHEAEDVTQEICLSVVRDQPVLRDPSRVRGWLYQLVVRRVTDCLRRRYRHEKLNAEIGIERGTGATSGEDVWSWILAGEQRQALTRALQEMDATQRELIVLRYVHDHSYEQLAIRFDVSRRAIEYQLVRAKKQLRCLIEQQQEIFDE